MSEPSNPSPFDRRSFFRKLFLRGVDEVSDRAHALGERLKPLTPFMNEEHHAERSKTAGGSATGQGATGDGTTFNAQVGEYDAAPLVRLRFLRPPGAITPDALFLETCSRCGECVKACPAQCIRLEGFEGSPGLPPAARASHTPRAGGAPFIIARESPCVVCSDLSCMKVCPTGALKLVEAVEAISMGVAVMDHERCLRGVGAPHVHAGLPQQSEQHIARAVKEDCRLCIESCPLGAAAIGLDGDSRIEIRPGCIGCGVCERACPTEPASVWVEPA